MGSDKPRRGPTADPTPLDATGGPGREPRYAGHTRSGPAGMARLPGAPRLRAVGSRPWLRNPTRDHAGRQVHLRPRPLGLRSLRRAFSPALSLAWCGMGMRGAGDLNSFSEKSHLLLELRAKKRFSHPCGAT